MEIGVGMGQGWFHSVCYTARMGTLRMGILLGWGQGNCKVGDTVVMGSL